MNRDETTGTMGLRAWDWPLVLDVVNPPSYFALRHLGRRHSHRELLDLERELQLQGYAIVQELMGRRVLAR